MRRSLINELESALLNYRWILYIGCFSLCYNSLICKLLLIFTDIEMWVQVAVFVLAAFQLGATQQCGMVLTTTEELKQEIRSEVAAALTINLSTSRTAAECAIRDNVTLERAADRIIHVIDQKMKQVTANTLAALEKIIEPISEEVKILLQLGKTSSRPASSCKEIKEQNPSSPSGYYWIESSSEPLLRVYCDMTKTCGGITGGWMRVANIDMSSCTETCPEGLKTLTVGSKRLCAMNINGAGCSSTSFTTHGVEYSRVCGKVIGYQQRSPDAFGPYGNNPSRTIDDVYVDGISLLMGAILESIFGLLLRHCMKFSLYIVSIFAHVQISTTPPLYPFLLRG